VPTDIIRVFILAQNRLLREALARLLSKKNDIQVAGAADFSPQLVEVISSACPDVLLADSTAFATPQMQLVAEFCAAVPGLKIVMIGMEADDESLLQAVRAGVAGYVLKEASALEVVSAVRAVARGEAVCPATLCAALFKYVAAHQLRTTFRLPLKRNLGLTRREQQLLGMIDQGLSNKEIASGLNLSEQTIKNHVHRILRKLGARDRRAAVELSRVPGAIT
jgi:two-component system nitrate/nitrite response regulator NarL